MTEAGASAARAGPASPAAEAPAAPGPRSRGARWTLGALLGLASAHYLWNALTVAPLTGYDGPGHAGYVLTILNEGQLPHPYLGWSSFHPPFYYLLGAGFWALLEPLGIQAVVLGLRLPGIAAGLATGAVAFWAVRRQGASLPVVAAATALVLFLPAAQFAATMIGNEGLAAGLAALTLGAALQLQRRPENVRWAVLAGAAAGLAAATKYSGALAVAAGGTPFLVATLHRRRIDPGVLRAALAFGAMVALLGAPTYVRNLMITGSPTPMTKQYDPMKEMEQNLVIRERRVVDFVWVPPSCLMRPALFHMENRAGSYQNRNPDMTSIWCLTYVSAWNDAFAHRVPVFHHWDGNRTAPSLAALGLVPTFIMLFGFGGAVAACFRRRFATPDAPLVVMGLLGLLLHVVYAISTASASGVKASYLLALAVPAAVFYGRAAMGLRPGLRAAVVGFSALAALASAVVYTNRLYYEANEFNDLRGWQMISHSMPYSHMMEALERLAGPWYE